MSDAQSNEITGRGQCPKVPEDFEAVHELRAVLRQAGVRVQTDPFDGCTVPPREGIALARLVRAAMQTTYETADALAECFSAHGLEMATPAVVDGKVDLGVLSVPAAAHLARLLGASAEEAVPECAELDDVSRWTHGDRISVLVGDTLKRATGATLVDHAFHADCLSCDTEMSITLGRISVDAAQRMVTALQIDP